MQVALVPDAVAVAAGRFRLTYRELDERANQWAHRLIGMGVRPAEPVAVLMERSPELIVVLLAVLKAGAVFLPLHAAYPVARMRKILGNAGGPVLLTDGSAAIAGLPDGDRTVRVDTDTGHRELARAAPATTTRPEDLACIIHTSGSTGDPRAVAVTHRGILGVALDSCWTGGDRERVLMLAPHAFAASIYEIWFPLLRGGRLVLAPPGRPDLGALRRLLRAGEITSVHLTAGLFRLVANEAPDCLATVGEVSTGGDVISPGAVRQVLAACPGITVRTTYGASEVTLFAAAAEITQPPPAAATVPVGRPMDDVALYVLDESLRPLDRGLVGELYIGGERLARGYSGRPDLTAARFVADPSAGAGARMYRTGDLARWTDDGTIDFVGRTDDLVKVRGFRVALAEVEAAFDNCPGITDVLVVAQRTDLGETRLVGYFVAGPEPVDVAALQEHAASVLPDYMIPSVFSVLDALPLTPNGKIDRGALPEPARTGTNPYRPPGTPRQEALCALFAAVLDTDRVGVDDSFFDLGGQSLTGMRLVNLINHDLRVELSIEQLFDLPTVSELDRHLAEAQ